MYPQPTPIRAMSECSGNGTEDSNGYCRCDAGWYGVSCEYLGNKCGPTGRYWHSNLSSNYGIGCVCNDFGEIDHPRYYYTGDGGSCTQLAGPNGCSWDGTSPFCSGDCGSNTIKAGETKCSDDLYFGSTECGSWCMFSGSKDYCCDNNVPAYPGNYSDTGVCSFCNESGGKLTCKCGDNISYSVDVPCPNPTDFVTYDQNALKCLPQGNYFGTASKCMGCNVVECDATSCAGLTCGSKPCATGDKKLSCVNCGGASGGKREIGLPCDMVALTGGNELQCVPGGNFVGQCSGCTVNACSGGSCDGLTCAGAPCSDGDKYLSCAGCPSAPGPVSVGLPCGAVNYDSSTRALQCS